jgi:zinc protease
MAFNGTERFANNRIIDFLNASGVEMGSDLNAFTTYNYTLYYFAIPADKPQLLHQALQILQQWATAISFDSSEVEKEKGVILEEIRRKSETEKTLHSFYAQGTRFKNHSILGTAGDIHSITPTDLAAFYHRWYQPHNMILIAVGGFDEVALSKSIVRTFGQLRDRSTGVIHPWDDTPSADKNVLTVYDPHDGQCYVDLTWANQAMPIANMPALEKEMLRDFVGGLVQQRLMQTVVLNNENIYNLKMNGRYLNRNTRLQKLRMAVKDDAHVSVVKNIWSEIQNIRVNGFSVHEIESAKQQKAIEINAALESTSFASEILRLLDSDVLGLPLVHPYIYSRLFKRYMQSIAPEEIHHAFNEMFHTDPNFIIAGVLDPTSGKHLASELVAAIVNRERPVKETASEHKTDMELPLPIVTAGNIVADETLDLLGLFKARRLRLSSGVTFCLKEIDDKESISFSFIAPGGKNALALKQLPAAEFLPKFTQFAMIDNRPMKAMQTSMTERGIDMRVFINENFHGFKGSFPKSQFEYVLGLIYQLMTKSAIEPNAFRISKQQLIDAENQREKVPKRALSLRVWERIYAHDPRRCPLRHRQLINIKPAMVLSVYRQLFSNANGFYFFYVGDKRHIDLKQNIERYLGGLPHRLESHRHISRPIALNERFGIIQSKENRPNRSDLRLIYFVHGHDKTYKERLTGQALFYILRARLDKTVREEQSLVYSIQLSKTASRFPADEWFVNIRFSCAPGNRDRIVELIQNEIRDISDSGPNETEFQGAVNYLKSRSTYLEYNTFFINSLFESHFINTSADIDGLRHQDLIEEVSRKNIAQLAQVCFGSKNTFVRVELNPPD